MATEIPQILGRIVSVENNYALIYEVPVGKQTMLASVVVTNRKSPSGIFRIGITNGAISEIPVENYILYDKSINGNDIYTKELPIALSAGEKVVGYADSNYLNFSLYGVELIP